MLFKVLSYNIHRAIGVDRRFQPGRIVDILKHHDADVVLLQEVDEGVPRSRELDLAKEIADASGYEHRAVGHNVSLRKGRYGNALLSRWPIEIQRNIDLTVGDRKRRGCLHARLKVSRPHSAEHRLDGTRPCLRTPEHEAEDRAAVHAALRSRRVRRRAHHAEDGERCRPNQHLPSEGHD